MYENENQLEKLTRIIQAGYAEGHTTAKDLAAHLLANGVSYTQDIKKTIILSNFLFRKH